MSSKRDNTTKLLVTALYLLAWAYVAKHAASFTKTQEVMASLALIGLTVAYGAFVLDGGPD